MSLAEDDIARIAGRVLEALDSASSIAPLSDEIAGFGLADGYRVGASLVALRTARGERPVGWKIGFTNRTIWDEYDVHAPIWGPIYDTTFIDADAGTGAVTCTVADLSEPRIEPEIAFRLGTSPHPDMDDEALIACIDGIAHGMEIVQSVFPGWRFQAADTIAAAALHGRYHCGPITSLAADADERRTWLARLRDFEAALFLNGEEADRGVAENVMGGGPIEALRAFVRGLAEHPLGLEPKPGDMVTTGTVTRAFPVSAGERWSSEVKGLPLPGLSVDFV